MPKLRRRDFPQIINTLRAYIFRSLLVALAIAALALSFAFMAKAAEYPVLPFKAPIPAPTGHIALKRTTHATAHPVVSAALVQPVLNPTYVKQYVIAQAKAYGVNPVKVDWIVGHESEYGARMRGDDGNSRGYFQISSIWHPEVSNKCADDLKCSTAWSLKRILAGHINEWSTYRLCKKIYKDCPF